MDLDSSFRHPKTGKLNDDSAPEDVLYYDKWVRCNRMSLMILKHNVPEVFRSAIANWVTSASEFLAKFKNVLQK